MASRRVRTGPARTGEWVANPGWILAEYDADMRSFFRSEKYFAPPMIGAAVGGTIGTLLAGAVGTMIGAVAGSGIGGLLSLGMASYDLALLATTGSVK